MIALVAAAVAISCALGSLGAAALFALRLHIPEDHPVADISVILPVTGLLPGFEAFLDALCTQSVVPRRVLIAIESEEDPAYQRIKSLITRYSELDIELVIAGLSARRAQKCTNILAAVAHLNDADRYIVFLDADIRPPAWWLAALVGPLAAGQADLVNGYRWQVPDGRSLAAILGCSIDRGIAVLPRLRVFNLIWGGSLALTRKAVETLDLPVTIDRVVTEDLPIGSRAAATGLRVQVRRALSAPTPMRGKLGDLWRFGRRQYQLIHIYRPLLWLYAAGVVSSDLLARIILIATVLNGEAPARVALPSLAIVVVLGSVTLGVRHHIGKRIGVPDDLVFRVTQHILAWTLVPAPAMHASMIWGGLITTPLTWAHIRYVIDRAGHVTGVERFPYRHSATSETSTLGPI